MNVLKQEYEKYYKKISCATWLLETEQLWQCLLLYMSAIEFSGWGKVDVGSSHSWLYLCMANQPSLQSSTVKEVLLD